MGRWSQVLPRWRNLLCPRNHLGFWEFPEDNFSLKLWFGTWTGFFPTWYATRWFWVYLVKDGCPTFDEYSPGILQITLHQRWWLWPWYFRCEPLPSWFGLDWSSSCDRLAIWRRVWICLHPDSGFFSVCMVGVGRFWLPFWSRWTDTDDQDMGFACCGGFLPPFTQDDRRGAIKGDVSSVDP